ncbi:MAG: prolyl oligopeptidase family serine peptidase [Planctomycetes bacterium]|nr:prolyl oligopeptidase family serine peptidase [Planctomycetota bacterium]
MRFRYPVFMLSISLMAIMQSASAGENQIIAGIEAFFHSVNDSKLEAIALTIEADPAFDRGKVSEWLHAASLFEAQESGEREIVIPIDLGQSRKILISIPEEYDPARPWPLIYALHGTGGSGQNITGYVKRLLGDRAGEFLIAAPTDYSQMAMGEGGPPSVEHPAVLLALKKMLHVNSDRVYITGYSKGGYATWTLATLHPDQFAAAIPIACTYTILPYVEGLWETMLPNLSHLPILHCWGENDPMPTLRIDSANPDASIARQNTRLVATTRRLGLTNIIHYMQPDTGHGGVLPPTSDWFDMLTRTRKHHPASFKQRFRYLHQSSAYWVEGLIWKGLQWTDQPLPFKPRGNEPMSATLGREIHKRLGALSGEIDAQTIHLTQQHIARMILWFGEGMIDWEQPVIVFRDGRKVADRKMEPDLLVCLTQARRTYDFDRLRWAGLDIRSGRRGKVVTGKTKFSSLIKNK